MNVRKRAELVPKAQALRARGLLQAEIAERLHISRSYANSLLRDPDGSRDKARKQRYGGTCRECGSRTTGSNGSAKAPLLCAKCSAHKRHVERHWNQASCVAAIKLFAERKGRPPSSSEWLSFPTSDYPPVVIVRREFGTWNAAIKAAGFQPMPRGNRRTDRRWVMRPALESVEET